MMEVLGTSCMQLTEDDKHALATYLGSLTAIHKDLDITTDLFQDPEFLE